MTPQDAAKRSDAVRRPPSALPDRRRSWPVLTVFALIVAVQLAVAAISLDLLSAVRAFVAGESLYSKGQKDAQIYLVDYALHQREVDYERFLDALAVPLGDRAAREALQRPDPDIAAARRGFIDGGNHPDDIDRLIRTFLWFEKTPLMADAIETWTAGDKVIAQMLALAARAHAKIILGDLNAPEVVEMREQVPQLNKTLTELESAFSAQLGVASRLTQQLLLGVNVALALLLGLTGLLFVRNSARVQAATENEVRRRQQSLQRLLDSTAEGLYGIDLQGRCTFINRAALKMLGYEREDDLLGRDIHALIHPPAADGGTRVPEESRLVQATRAGEALHVPDDTFRRRDGSSFPVEYWSHPMVRDGQMHGAVQTFFDISERRTMQAALRQGVVRMAGLVDAVNDGVVTVDAGDRIVQFNRAAERLFGASARTAIGGSVERFIPRRQFGPGGRTQRFASLVTGPADEVQELVGRRADGHEFPLEASLSRIETERGPLVTAVLRDVSRLHEARAERQALEALEAANRAKTEFLSRMSHELRTPLNAVLGFAQLLRLDPSRPPSLTQLERIQHIESAGSHLLALVNDVLDLSRVESGQMTMTLAPVDLDAVVADAVAMVSPLAATAEVELRAGVARTHAPEATLTDGGCGQLWVLADPLRLRQVLVNLLSNAVKYNRAGGHVWLDWDVRGDGCHIRVADNGVGIAPEKLERLFEPFNRLGAEKSEVEGTGIGLVLSRRLTELMKGELRVASEVGVGTTATIVIARTNAPASVPAEPVPPSQHAELEEGLRVLYAEDNEVNVELVRQIVTLRPAVTLDIAENGATALQSARRLRPDLMLIDMNLGDMTGIDLAAALRLDAGTSAIRLVALSADALPEQIDAALAAGFESYLTKPIDFRELLGVLDGCKPELSRV